MAASPRLRCLCAVALVLWVVSGGCGRHGRSVGQAPAPPSDAEVQRMLDGARTPAMKVVYRARLEVARQVRYDAGYARIPYPNGDIAADRGACTDVIVRGLRAAGYDLQKLIAEDKRAHPSIYPVIGGSARPDPNIDHRRTPNHIAYFRRHALTLATSIAGRNLRQWQPGDLVYVDLGRMLHCGVISDRKNDAGVPYLIHNIGPVASEEDVLGRWRILGHFRYPA